MYSTPIFRDFTFEHAQDFEATKLSLFNAIYLNTEVKHKTQRILNKCILS